jgi:hypothetical protein
LYSARRAYQKGGGGSSTSCTPRAAEFEESMGDDLTRLRGCVSGQGACLTPTPPNTQLQEENLLFFPGRFPASWVYRGRFTWRRTEGVALNFAPRRVCHRAAEAQRPGRAQRWRGQQRRWRHLRRSPRHRFRRRAPRQRPCRRLRRCGTAIPATPSPTGAATKLLRMEAGRRRSVLRCPVWWILALVSSTTPPY